MSPKLTGTRYVLVAFALLLVSLGGVYLWLLPAYTVFSLSPPLAVGAIGAAALATYGWYRLTTQFIGSSSPSPDH
jgi:hypothetical protein